LFKKIKNILRNNPINRIRQLEARANSADAHLIALSRLVFIKPEVLYREVNNAKANTDYIANLFKALNEENSTQKENKS
jgi:hypothetical protein